MTRTVDAKSEADVKAALETTRDAFKEFFNSKADLLSGIKRAKEDIDGLSTEHIGRLVQQGTDGLANEDTGGRVRQVFYTSKSHEGTDTASETESTAASETELFERTRRVVYYN